MMDSSLIILQKRREHCIDKLQSIFITPPSPSNLITTRAGQYDDIVVIYIII